MSKEKKLSFDVLGTSITVLSRNDEDYISLTDMLKAKEGDFFIGDWLRNRNTVEFLGIWERVHNPDFNYGEFDIIKSQAGLNSYRISVKDWTAKTNALGLRATTGRYGGTYAHKDIAFEFGMWISAEFKVYLIKEFQRLKDDEISRLRWNGTSSAPLPRSITASTQMPFGRPSSRLRSRVRRPRPFTRARPTCSTLRFSGIPPESGATGTPRQRAMCATRQPSNNWLC